jgi:ribosome modulation factor
MRGVADIDALRRAIAEGRAARQADRLITVCPYTPGTLRDLFVRGYVAARRTGVTARGRSASSL